MSGAFERVWGPDDPLIGEEAEAEILDDIAAQAHAFVDDVADELGLSDERRRRGHEQVDHALAQKIAPLLQAKYERIRLAAADRAPCH